MKTFNTICRLALTAFLVSQAPQLLAQPNGHAYGLSNGNGNGNSSGNGNGKGKGNGGASGAPIDGGASLLLAGGVAYAVRRVRQARKKA
ncbi:PID-CTERM protein-sorting domain-containing protein [Hymenobacter arizonensis]|uniref:MYXO-CTERM domain-containing protein n=1 Tax=Hymenobacter arizonensis TaxID=1227077 RepID=A0A1I6BQ42_HYMAR|nr:VPEID-CTERM sorting domain-containing protein [Hymenobacter arizonensis]SFQ83058.1 hypothetical protein SAMN04515668_4898 [Hymenobacter arizonensis]